MIEYKCARCGILLKNLAIEILESGQINLVIDLDFNENKKLYCCNMVECMKKGIK